MSKHNNYNKAVQDIKQAILCCEYAKGKTSNAQRLELYLAVGGYLCKAASSNNWKREALDAISESLQDELCGLRGFSPYNLALMCRFYHAWAGCLPAGNDYTRLNLRRPNPDGSTSIIVWDRKEEGGNGFPIKEFLGIGFTHHRWIMSLAKTDEERRFYVCRCFEKHYSVAALKQAIKNDEYHNQGVLIRCVPATKKRGQRLGRKVGALGGGFANLLACVLILSRALGWAISAEPNCSQPRLLTGAKAA